MGYPNPCPPISTSQSLKPLKHNRFVPLKYTRAPLRWIRLNARSGRLYPSSTDLRRKNDPLRMNHVLTCELLVFCVLLNRGQSAYESRLSSDQWLSAYT